MLIEYHPSAAAAALDEDEDVKKLLEGFAKKSLVLLAKEAVSMYPILIKSVRKLAVFDPRHSQDPRVRPQQEYHRPNPNLRLQRVWRD